MIRAVIDPGVLIAGLISSRGAPAGIIRAWQHGVFEMIVSAKLLDELTATLLRPKFRRWISENDAIAFVEILRLSAIGIDDPTTADRVSRDPDDDYLIALARVGGANVLVSGDRDLTSIEGNEPPIVASRRFLETVGRS